MTTDTDKAETLNNFFISTFTKDRVDTILEARKQEYNEELSKINLHVNDIYTRLTKINQWVQMLYTPEF